MDLTEKQLTSKEIYDGVVIHLYRDTVLLPDGKEGIREIIRHPGAVCVLPIDDEGNCYFVHQFRYAFNRVTLEAPAGKLEYGEELISAAKRELSEETGFDAEKLISLGEMYTTPALIDEVIHLYLARGLTPGSQHTDDDEFLEVEKIPFKTAVEMAANDKIRDSKTVTILLKAEKYLNSERTEK